MQTRERGAAFWEWFEGERHQRRLSLRAIEGAGGLPSGWLRKRMAAGLQPTFENCKTIAAAFGLPVEEVLRRAGHLPMTESRSDLDEIAELASYLTPEHRAMLAELARALTALERRTGEQARYRVVGQAPPPSLEEFRRQLGKLTRAEREHVLHRWLASVGLAQEPGED